MLAGHNGLLRVKDVTTSKCIRCYIFRGCFVLERNGRDWCVNGTRPKSIGPKDAGFHMSLDTVNSPGSLSVLITM